jgi:hypothetical protein
MKIRITGISFLILAISIVLSSYVEGPAIRSGWDCSGAESGLSNPTGCNASGGCHSSSATAGITVVLELDSAGIPVNGYRGGKTYTVRLSGTNTTSSSLPAFGFQVAAILGSTEQVTPTTAGTWGTAPVQTHIAAPRTNDYVLSIFEQSSAISATTGGGAHGSTYVDSISWTAPAAGTGTVSFWAALNAVNRDGNADQGDLWNVTHLVVAEDTVAQQVNGIAVLPAGDINVYPNPVNDLLNIQWNNSNSGTYTLSIYNINGQLITTEKNSLMGGLNTQSISTSAWLPGIYFVQVQSGDAARVFRIVKQ